MGKSSITNIVKADQKNSTEPFGKIKDQLDETQADGAIYGGVAECSYFVCPFKIGTSI